MKTVTLYDKYPTQESFLIDLQKFLDSSEKHTLKNFISFFNLQTQSNRLYEFVRISFSMTWSQLIRKYKNMNKYNNNIIKPDETYCKQSKILNCPYILKKESELQSINDENKKYKELSSNYKEYSLKLERMFNQINSSLSKMDISKFIHDCKKKNKYNDNKNNSTDEVLILLSDFHVGEEVSPNDTLNFGNYNIEVFLRRLQYLSKRIRYKIQNSDKHYSVLHIALLGDIVSGIIHEELVENVLGCVTDWVLIAAYALERFIMDMLEIFDEIHCIGVVGNHGRVNKKKGFKHIYNNFDYIVYQLINTFFRLNKNMTFDFSTGPFLSKEICDKRFVFCHGDNIKSYQGIPWYGITRAHSSVTSLFSSNNQNIDYFVLGHFHNSASLQHFNAERFINGSMLGLNEFSMSNSLGSRPSQLMMYVPKDKNEFIEDRVIFILDHSEVYTDELLYTLPEYINQTLTNN